jgi:hypothetical protein
MISATRCKARGRRRRSIKDGDGGGKYVQKQTKREKKK